MCIFGQDIEEFKQVISIIERFKIMEMVFKNVIKYFKV